VISSDGLRLALGTFTIAPVPPPRMLDRRVGAQAMAWAPLIGASLGGLSAAGLEGVRQVTHHSATGTLLAAVVAVAALAWLTRGLHLDGLADTADGLGSGLPQGGALEVMRASDIGPFGVVTLVLVLAVQVAAIGESVSRGTGWLGLVVSVATGRLAASWGCSSRLRAARPDGLGALVAGSLRTPVLLALAAAVAAAAAALSTLDDDPSGALALRSAAAVVVGLAVAGLLLRRCVRRFGGITGDVLGALVESATTAALLCFALV
jgi:adenosylcobinamide-GDP ribazoletransferase